MVQRTEPALGLWGRRSEGLRVIRTTWVSLKRAPISRHMGVFFSPPPEKRQPRLYWDAIRLFWQETSNSARHYLQQGLIACGTNTSFTATSTEMAVRLHYVTCSNVELNIAAVFGKCARKRHNGEEIRSLGKVHTHNPRLVWPTPRQSSCSRPAPLAPSLPAKCRTAGKSRLLDQHWPLIWPSDQFWITTATELDNA